MSVFTTWLYLALFPRHVTDCDFFVKDRIFLYATSISCLVVSDCRQNYKMCISA